MNMNHQTHCPVSLIGRTLRCFEDLEKAWGNARLGLQLVDAHFQELPLTTDELAARCSASDTTVRRHLQNLINIGRALPIKQGRGIRYQAHPDWAKWTCDRVVALAERPPPKLH